MWTSLFTIFHILTLFAADGQIFSEQQKADLASFIEDVLECSKVPAITVSVVKKDEVFTKAYGLRDVNRQIPATDDTLFCIGSITKAFTSTLLSKKLPEKFARTMWNTKVKDILTDSFKLFTDELTDSVTLKDILSHRTGLAPGDFGLFAGYPATVSRKEMVSRLQYLPAEVPFRDRFLYNNWMYFLAGYIAEVIYDGNKNWEELITENILQPLGMNSTFTLKNLTDLIRQKTDVALPYIYQDGETKLSSYDIYNIYPSESAGALCSTSKDMARWIQFVLQTEGSPALNSVVNDTAFNQTTQPIQFAAQYYQAGLTIPTFPVEDQLVAYSMGWFVGSYRGYKRVSHSGSLFSYSALLYLFPEIKSGVYVAINGIDDADKNIRYRVTSYISDLLMGETPWLNSTTACTFPEPWTNKTETNSTRTNQTDYEPGRAIEDYVGVYGHRLIGDVKIESGNENQLRVKLGRVEGVLSPSQKKDVFLLELTGVFSFLSSQATISQHAVHFIMEDGQVKKVYFSAVGQQFLFSKDVRFDSTSKGSNSSVHLALMSFSSLVLLCLSSSLFS